MPLVFRSASQTRFDWNPDLDALEARLLVMDEYFEHPEAFILDARDEAQVDMARRFEDEVDPTGLPWPPLKMPAPEQVGILRLTTEMYDRAIEDAWVVAPTGLFFDTSVLPPYWQYHEFGSGSTHRDPAGMGAAMSGNIGHGIPQRAFIGISRVSQERLQDRFAGWVRGGIELGSRGYVRQVRAPSGVFRALPG